MGVSSSTPCIKSEGEGVNALVVNALGRGVQVNFFLFFLIKSFFFFLSLI